MLGMIVGGIVPAFLWGLTAVLQKKSADALLGPNIYLIVFGITSASIGTVATLFRTSGSASIAGLTFAALAGTSFAIGTDLSGMPSFP